MPVFKMIDRCAIAARVRAEVAPDIAEHKHSPGRSTILIDHERPPTSASRPMPIVCLKSKTITSACLQTAAMATW
jgi:hypothetical protein